MTPICPGVSETRAGHVSSASLLIAVAAFCLEATCLLAFEPIPGGGLAVERSATMREAQTLLGAKCGKCHGDVQPKGGVRLPIPESLAAATRAEFFQRAWDAIDARDMPPEGEPPLSDVERDRLLRGLKAALNETVASGQPSSARIHRLTRWQYNNAVRDLFQLNRDLFDLPERLMLRLDYHAGADSGRMPDRVRVAPPRASPPPVLAGVKPFPKDLRAEHGFDNQADKLTMSPLLLDSLLRLAGSIVDSPDFNAKNVGIWDGFFCEPAADQERKSELERRLRPFLRLAFRGPVDDVTVRRYADFADAKIASGASFPDAMKRVATAILSSPLFLFRSSAPDGSESQFELASRLSFFLWSSIPDAELLGAAERGELARPDELRRAIERMMADRRIERFLDTFPAQWLQLENALAVTPDPKLSPYFQLDPDYPASLPMVFEPLLLFDAAFMENRPVSELIAPAFSYRSDFLRDWYETDLVPPAVDESAVVERNRQLQDRRRELEMVAATARMAIDSLTAPVRRKLAAERKKAADSRAPIDLKPLAVWEFNGDLGDSLQTLPLTAHGNIKFVDGRVLLENAYLQSVPLKRDLRAKTLEAWCELTDVRQRGGGVMSIQGPGDFFDAIVLGERQPGHWISGSNRFARTDDFPESTAETRAGERLHLAMVYDADGTTQLFRNGAPYGKPFQKDSAIFPKDTTSVLFGLRHIPPGGNKFLSVWIDKARLYDRALTADEIAIAAAGDSFDVSLEELARAMPPADAEKLAAAREQLARHAAELDKLPGLESLKSLRDASRRRFEEQLRRNLRASEFQRTALTDPRYGGVITNAAVLSMTSGPQRTQPVARGSWVIEAIFNDPPLPPPNNVPPLKESDDSRLTIRERFAAHRAEAACAGCHAKIDPLGFALENYDITGRWRDKYENGRPVDASGVLLRQHAFVDAVQFKAALIRENPRFARALAAHLLRYALARELSPADTFTLDDILSRTKDDGFRLRSLIFEIALNGFHTYR